MEILELKNTFRKILKSYKATTPRQIKKKKMTY
jgi:hypothetical protein